MNLKQLITFGIEESQEPVIKNPVLRAALQEPRNMAHGGTIIPLEKPKLPQIKILADRLQTYIKAGAIKKDYATQLLQDKMKELGVSEEELGTITGRRGEAHGGRIELKEGQLVRNTADGSRPGYNGEDKITKLAKEYQKATGSETTLANIKSKIRKKRLTEDLIDQYKKRGAYGGGFRKKIEAVKNPKFYKTVLSELNKIKKQRNRNVFFDYDNVIRTGEWYKNLRTKLGNLNDVDTDTIIKKVLNEEFPGSYYGKTAIRDFRRDSVVKAFVNYLDVNGELDGNEKRLPELQKFRGTGNKSYRNINETFQEWANGDFEVEGIDRKKLKADQIKQIKNWSPQYSSSLSVAKEKSMKFLNDLNTHNPNLSAKEVRQRFFKRFPDVTDGSFNARITHLTQLKNSGVYTVGAGTKTFKWIVPDKNRSPWLKELLGLKFQGNYSSFINRGDKLLNQGLTEEANRLYAAAEKYFGAKGIFTKAEGQGEHPFSRVFGSGPIGNELKINSLVRNDLNQFKRLNFDEPVIQDLTEYNKSTTTPKRRNELKTLIEGRKKLMNYLTESPNEKGIVESVKFNYGPKRMTGSANVVDIDKVKNFNVEDYVKRGGSYLEAFKAKGTGLFEESGQIIKKKLGKDEILQLMKTAKTAKGPAKLKALGALVTMLGAGAVYELGFSPTELQAAEAQAGETGVVDKAKSWPVEHPWLTGGAATGASKLTKADPLKLLRKIPRKILSSLGTPAGAVAAWPLSAMGMKKAGWMEEDASAFDIKSTGDRIGAEAEVALAPTLVKWTDKLTKPIKNKAVRSGVTQLLNLGMKLPTAMKVARIASPIGLLSLAGEGIYHAGKKEMARRAELSPEELADFHLERQSRGWAGKKGIMGLKKKKW